MTTHSPTSGVRAGSRRKTSETAAVLPKAIAVRTDRLVEIADQCGDAKRIADEMGEGFLAFLLSMVIEETRTAMRRATVSVPSRVQRKGTRDPAP